MKGFRVTEMKEIMMKEEEYEKRRQTLTWEIQNIRDGPERRETWRGGKYWER